MVAIDLLLTKLNQQPSAIVLWLSYITENKLNGTSGSKHAMQYIYVVGDILVTVKGALIFQYVQPQIWFFVTIS